MPVLLYFLKTMLCSAILFSYYWCCLRNRAFNSYNRFYLLGIVLLSLCLPFIKINFWQQQTIQSSGVIQLLQTVSGDGEREYETARSIQGNSWDEQQTTLLIYALISAGFLFAFIRTIMMIVKLIAKHPAKKMEGFFLISAAAKGTPFSFFNYIFWNSNIDIDSPTGRQILQHEIAHIQGRHTCDKLFMNLLLVFFWSNPFFWLIKKELGMIHEFIADKKAVTDNDAADFAAMLLQAAYPQHTFQLTNNFFHSPIKRRLTMLTKNNNPISYFSRILALPLLLMVFAAFTFKPLPTRPGYTGEKTIVIIDAGHGGDDAGARAANGTAEKDITLAIAQKIKLLNTNKNVEIILSRKDDTYQSPQQRTDLAKSSKANLFISLHVDTKEEGSNENKSGVHLFIPQDNNIAFKESELLGSSLIDELGREASINVSRVINKMNTPAWILKANPCPAVLIEAGYVTNDTDLAFLQSGKGQELLARNILNGVEKYLIASAKTMIVP